VKAMPRSFFLFPSFSPPPSLSLSLSFSVQHKEKKVKGKVSKRGKKQRIMENEVLCSIEDIDDPLELP